MKNIKKFDEFINEGIKKVANTPELVTDILKFLSSTILSILFIIFTLNVILVLSF